MALLDRALDLIAGGPLLARQLGVRGAGARPLAQVRWGTAGDPLPRGQVAVCSLKLQAHSGSSACAKAAGSPGRGWGDRASALAAAP